MAFPPPTYILQQQAGQPPNSPQPSFSYQNTFSAPSAHLPQSFAPISGSQTAPWTAQPHELVASQAPLSLPYIQTLEQQLHIALRKNREYEETILDMATHGRLCPQHGTICLDCKKGGVHACFPTHSLFTSSSLRPPLSPYEHQQSSTLAHLTGLRTHLTIPMTPGSLFGEPMTAHSTPALVPSTSHIQPMPPSSSNIFGFTSNSYPTHFAGPTAQGNIFGTHAIANFAPASFESSVSCIRSLPQSNSDLSSAFTSLPNLMPLTFPSRAASLCSPGSSIAVHPQYNSSNDTSWLGKRDIHPIDLNCEPERKKARQNFPDKRSSLTYQQSESYLPPRVTPPSSKDSFPPLDTMSTVPESPATTYGHVTPQLESEDWSITCNSEVKRPLDVSSLCPLQVGHPIQCMAFSKDGKHLAVGLYDDVTINIYDVHTGERTCILRHIVTGHKCQRYHQFIYAVCFSPNGLHLAAGGTDNLIRIWEIQKKHVRNVLRCSRWPLSRISFSSDGRLLASGTLSPSTLEIWNWRDGSRKFSEAIEEHIPDIHYDDGSGIHSAHIHDVQFSPDGRYIAVAVFGSDILIWNRSGQLVERFMAHPFCVCSVAFTLDGTGLVSGGSNTVKLWDISSLSSGSERKEALKSSTAKELLCIKEHKASVFFAAVSSNRRWVVSGSHHGNMCISDAHSGELHCELCPSNDYAESNEYEFDFNPVSDCLAACRYQGSQVFLWRFKEVVDRL